MWICRLNWTWVSGPSAGGKWAPFGPQPRNPVGSHVEYCVNSEYMAKLRLGFWVVYGVRRGPQLGAIQKPQLGAMKMGLSPDADDIPVELLMHGGR